MGLDKDDTIVKRRMAQKMQFLAEDVAAARECGAVLRDHSREHLIRCQASFRMPRQTSSAEEEQAAEVGLSVG